VAPRSPVGAHLRALLVACRVVVRVYLFLAGLVTSYGFAWASGAPTALLAGGAEAYRWNSVLWWGLLGLAVLFLSSTLMDGRAAAGWPYALLGFLLLGFAPANAVAFIVLPVFAAVVVGVVSARRGWWARATSVSRAGTPAPPP
jgi:hypothetical protein